MKNLEKIAEIPIFEPKFLLFTRKNSNFLQKKPQFLQGKFGAECKFECNCQNGATCDNTNGKCICKSGYHGALCENECSVGFFGSGCTQKCDCLNNQNCDSSSGECKCIGWTGKHCDIGCSRGRFGLQCKQNCTCPGLEFSVKNLKKLTKKWAKIDENSIKIEEIPLKSTKKSQILRYFSSVCRFT